MEKPLMIKILAILYLLAGIGLLILPAAILYLYLTDPTFIPNLLSEIFPTGGFNAGDTFITIDQIYSTLLFLIPMGFITGILSLSGGYLALISDKKMAWILMVAASILYCLIIIGLITDYIFLQEDVKKIYNV